MRDGRNGRLMKPIGAPEGGVEWSWVMSVFSQRPQWCSKCMEARFEPARHVVRSVGGTGGLAGAASRPWRAWSDWALTAGGHSWIVRR